MTRGDGVLRAPGTGISGRTAALVLGIVLALSAVVVVSRQEGLPKQLIANLRGTRWLVYEPAGLAVLADSVTGRIVVQLDAATINDKLVALQGEGGAYLINRARGEAITIDEQNVRLDAGRAVPALVAESRSLVMGVGANGAVAASLTEHAGVLVPPSGPVAALQLPEQADRAQVATDGTIWAVDSTTSTVYRQQGTSSDVFPSTAAPSPNGDIDVTTVGTDAVVLDRSAGTLRWLPDNDTVELPSGAPNTDAVLQQPGVESDCVWIARVDQLSCVGRDGSSNTVRLDSLIVDRNDRLAVTNGYALLVRERGNEIISIRLSSGTTEPVRFTATSPLDEPVLSVDATGIWLDDPQGQTAVVVTAQGPKLIAKIDDDAPMLGKDGKPIAGDNGVKLSSGDTAGSRALTSSDDVPEPDEDGVDEPPIARDDSASAREGIEVAVIATANDYDPDGDPIVLVDVTDGRNGTVSILDSTTLVYTPDAGTVGTDTFSYTISDPAGSTDSADVTVEMIDADAPNRAPAANPDRAETVPNRAVVIDVLRNDFDPERTQLSVADVTPPDEAKGSVERTILSDGRTALKFTPGLNFIGGTATFSYRAGDADGGKSTPAEVTVTVAAAGLENRPPVAVPDSARTRVEQSVQILVLANDTDPDNDLLIITDVKLKDARHGEVRRSGRSILFVPAASAPDLVLLQYTISDGNEGVATGKVLVSVLPDTQENGPPVAAPDEFSAPSRTLTFDPTRNDKDPDNDALTLLRVTQPTDGGTTTKLAGNSVSFVPEANRAGTFRFTYVITDGMGHEATGHVAVTILPARRPDGPTAMDDQAETIVNTPVTINVLGNDSDPSGDQLQLDGRPNCQYGRCDVNSDQTITFTPPRNAFSTYRFTYRVRNSVGQAATATVAVQVQQAPVVNSSPVAHPDPTRVARGASTIINVLDNDEDEQKDALKIKSFTQPTSGTVEKINQTLKYTSATVGPQVVTFQYTVEDAGGKTGTATVTVEILEPTNQAPVAVEDARTFTQGSAIPDLDVVQNDYDPDGTNDLLQLVGAPQVVSGDANAARSGTRTIRLTPASSFTGTIRVRYEIADPGGLKATGSYVVTVNPPANAAPSALDDVASTNQNFATDIAVLANDGDPDGDQLSVEITAAPSPLQGTASVLPDHKTVRFTPAPDYSGPASFQYRAVDTKGTKSGTATVRINVIACTQGTPITTEITRFTPYGEPIALDLLAAGQLDFALTISDENGGQVSDGGAPGTVIFTPSNGNNGFGSFRYTVTNSCNVSRNGSVSIDVNRAPKFVGGSFTATVDTPLSVPVAQIASDDEPLVITEASPSSIATIGADGSLVFASSDVGPVTIGVTVRDPGGLTVSGTLSFDVQPPANVPPTAGNIEKVMEPSSSIVVDVIAVSNDPDGPASGLQIELVTTTSPLTSGTGGTISAALSADSRSVVITAGPGTNGVGNITYRVIDERGAPSATATIKVVVNRAPSANPASGGFVSPGDTGQHTPNVNDPDGNTVTVSNPVSSSADVTVAMVDAETFEYTVGPAAQAGSVVITYTVTDSLGFTATGTYTLNVVVV
ncbi:MAG: Ig-like domain-containing protein [Acidimicrobiia bacterium]